MIELKLLNQAVPVLFIVEDTIVSVLSRVDFDPFDVVM